MKPFLLTLLLLITFSAQAAETSYTNAHASGVGLRPQLIDGKADLLDEDVSITLGLHQAFVRSKYTITNSTKHEQQIDIGFPMLDDKELGVTSIKVDDKLTRFRHLPAILSVKEQKRSVLWRYWMITLAPKQKAVLHTKTIIKSDTKVDSPHTPYLQHRAAIWQEFTQDNKALPKDIAAHLKKMVSMNAGYMARFNQWKRPVESMTLSIHNASKVRSFFPSNGSVTKDTLHWSFKGRSKKPTFFHIEYNPYLSLSEEIALVKELLKHYPQSTSIKSYQRYLRALHKRS